LASFRSGSGISYDSPPCNSSIGWVPNVNDADGANVAFNFAINSNKCECVSARSRGPGLLPGQVLLNFVGTGNAGIIRRPCSARPARAGQDADALVARLLYEVSRR